MVGDWITTQWTLKNDFEDMQKVVKITIDRMNSPFYEGERFAVRRGDRVCLNVVGEWEYEPIPSSRDDAFYQRCRFKTFTEACEMAEKHKGKVE